MSKTLGMHSSRHKGLNRELEYVFDIVPELRYSSGSPNASSPMQTDIYQFGQLATWVCIILLIV